MRGSFVFAHAAVVATPAIVAASFGSVALAQSPASQTNDQNPPAIETIVVTARKHSEAVQTVPESISVIDAQTLEHARVSAVDDLNSFVPNLNITQRADNTPDVVLRGVGSYGVVQGVGFYIDDVQQFEGQTIRPFDVSRVEVLTGPQGTLYGGSNIGGAIRYISRNPTDYATAEASVETGGFAETAIDGAISGPLVGDDLLARLSFYNTHSSGYLYDPFLNTKFGGSHEFGIRPVLQYLEESDDIRLSLAYDRTQGASENNYYTPPTDNTYLRTLGVGTAPKFFRELYSPTLNFKHQFDELSLTSITSYFHSNIGALNDLDKGPLPIANLLQGFRKQVWSEEVRLASDSSAPLKWLIGAFAQGVNTDTNQTIDVGLAAITQNINDKRIIFSIPLNNTHRQRSYALFGHLIYDFESWTIESGLRLTHYDNWMLDTTAGCAPCEGQVNVNDVLPMVSLSYHFDRGVMTYFTASRGFEPADLTDEPNASNNDNVHAIKAEHALSYEIGLKSTFLDGRLQLNVAAFDIDYTNRLFEVGSFTGQGLIQYLTNIGPSTNTGFEVQAITRPIRELTLSGGFGLTEAKWGSAKIFDAVTGTVVNLDGKDAPNTPEYDATLSANWVHPLEDGLDLGVRVDGRFVGRSWWDPQDHFKQRPYQVVNAGIWLDIGDHWTIAGHVRNLLDGRYNTGFYSGVETGAPFNEASINMPRQWLVTLSARY